MSKAFLNIGSTIRFIYRPPTRHFGDALVGRCSKISFEIAIPEMKRDKSESTIDELSINEELPFTVIGNEWDGKKNLCAI